MNAKIDNVQGSTASEIEILDTTLRDGSYAADFQLEEDLVVDVMRGLDASGIKFIEMGHGVGIEAERTGARASNISLDALCDLANDNISKAKWGVFAQPGFSRLKTIEKLCSKGMSFLRVGVELDALEGAADYLHAVTEICDEVHFNLMKTSDTTAEQMLSISHNVPEKIKTFYIVDSYGAMAPDQVDTYVRKIQGRFPTIGFHGHDNLGLANANGLAAIAAGASLVDGTLHGIGRGSGNSATEALAGILVVQGKGQYKYQQLAQLADQFRREVQALDCDRYLQVLGGVIGVHTGLFPLIEELCSELTVNPATVMEKASRIAPQGPRECDVRAAAQEIALQNA